MEIIVYSISSPNTKNVKEIEVPTGEVEVMMMNDGDDNDNDVTGLVRTFKNTTHILRISRRYLI